jgi:hypothetical protein
MTPKPGAADSSNASESSPPPPDTNSTTTDSVVASAGSPLSTPSNLSPAPGDPTNHWWDLWSFSQASLPFDGSFVAGNNYINGMNSGDQILFLPMNVALGSTTHLNWFQFDIEYYDDQGNQGVDWYIWDIISPGGLSTCNPTDSQFHQHDISSSPPGSGDVDPDVVTGSGGGGLSYNPGDSYTWSLYPTDGSDVVFLVTDLSNGNFWWTEFSVSSFNLVVNGSCFSPVSGVEGYTSDSTTSLSNVGFFGFNVKETATAPASENFEGSGEPPGIETTAIQYDGTTSGGGDWYWDVYQGGTFPVPYTCGACVSFPATLDLGQTAHIIFSASNLGYTAATQTMTISFPGASESDLSVLSSDLGTEILGAGSSFPGCYDQCVVPLSYPLVQGRSDNWGSGVVHTITVGFTPSTTGTYTFYYKTVATAGYPGDPSVWSPDSTESDTQDQQGEWVYAGTITVTIPYTIALVNDATSNPISGANHFTAQYTSGGTDYAAYFTGSSPLTLHVDGNSHIKISGTSSDSSDQEKWCLTSSCDELDLFVSSTSTGKSLTYYYFDLLRQQVSAKIIDGGTPAIPLDYTTAPSLYFVSDNPKSVEVSFTDTTQTLYTLRGTGADVPACTPFTIFPGLHGPLTLCDDENWAILPGTATSWTITSSDQIPSSFKYYHQYFEELSFTTSDGIAPPSNPTFSSMQFGSPYTTPLSMTTPVDVFLDAGVPYSITPNPLTGSGPTEQWEGVSALLSNTLYEPLLPFTQYAEYSHQYLITFEQTGLDSTTGTNTVLSVTSSADLMPADFTYSQFPVGAWIDSGAVANYVYTSPVHTSDPSTEFALQSVTGLASGFTVSGTTTVEGDYASEPTTVATCAGTFPTDTCTGTPSQPSGTLSVTSTSTMVSVDVSGTSASGTVTLTISDDGDTPPPTGADINLGGGGAYYDVQVSGASDGVALVCITNFNIYFGTTMDYWNGASWVGAANIEVIGNVICGDVPVSALSGSPIGIGTPSPSCAGTSPVEICEGIPIGGFLSVVSAATGVGVDISGTSATGPVTITISDYGGTPPAVGVDPNLLGAFGHYYDVSVSGATDGSAEICVPPSNGATVMDYYGSSTPAWTPANGVTLSAAQICGNIPLPLTGTPIVIGTPTPPPQGVPEFPTSAVGQLAIVAVGLLCALLARQRRVSKTDASLRTLP